MLDMMNILDDFLIKIAKVPTAGNENCHILLATILMHVIILQY